MNLDARCLRPCRQENERFSGGGPGAASGAQNLQENPLRKSSLGARRIGPSSLSDSGFWLIVGAARELR
jgi:hypothetical protein